jgi:prophage maintenance system killer protein
MSYPDDRLETKLSLIDILVIAEPVLGVPAEVLARTISLSAVTSALAAPFETFAVGEYLYPDPIMRAAVCCSRVARGHLFPERNARIAYLCMTEMLERSGIVWRYPAGDLEESQAAAIIEMLERREIPEQYLVDWIQLRVRSSSF